MAYPLAKENMNWNKFLVIITDKKQIEIARKARITNFLFPLKDFCVGYEKTFAIKELPKEENTYLYINRILDTESYEKLRILLKELPASIKGIVFEDFGLITLLEELNLKQEKILYQTHFATNHQSINENLKFVDSVVISTDITEEEVIKIVNQCDKPLVYFLYGLVPAMYSRRNLLTNYEEEFHLPEKKIAHLHENISNRAFKAIENEYGTVLYHAKYVNGVLSLPDDKIKFYLINPLQLESEEFEKVLEELKQGKNQILTEEDQGFLHQKTIYKIKEIPKETK